MRNIIIGSYWPTRFLFQRYFQHFESGIVLSLPSSVCLSCEFRNLNGASLISVVSSVAAPVLHNAGVWSSL